jgi:hypothetical protein
MYRRQEAQRSIRKVLIVCEGKKTERYYFEAFQTNAKLIKVEVLGAGRNKDSLVEYAIELKKQSEKDEPYSSIWCVFDRDSYAEDSQDKHKFNRAICIARNNQIRVAYSNDAFEIWYILHYVFYQTPLDRGKYGSKLTTFLGLEYEKNDKTMYEKLIDRQPVAIKNAKNLLASYGAKHNPEIDNPCTTVHLLVEFLNEYLEGE